MERASGVKMAWSGVKGASGRWMNVILRRILALRAGLSWMCKGCCIVCARRGVMVVCLSACGRSADCQIGLVYTYR